MRGECPIAGLMLSVSALLPLADLGHVASWQQGRLGNVVHFLGGAGGVGEAGNGASHWKWGDAGRGNQAVCSGAPGGMGQLPHLGPQTSRRAASDASIPEFSPAVVLSPGLAGGGFSVPPGSHLWTQSPFPAVSGSCVIHFHSSLMPSFQLLVWLHARSFLSSGGQAFGLLFFCNKVVLLAAVLGAPLLPCSCHVPWVQCEAGLLHRLFDIGLCLQPPEVTLPQGTRGGVWTPVLVTLGAPGTEGARDAAHGPHQRPGPPQRISSPTGHGAKGERPCSQVYLQVSLSFPGLEDLFTCLVLMSVFIQL